MSTLLKILKHNHTEKQTPLDGAEDSNTQEDVNETSARRMYSLGRAQARGQRGLQPLFMVTFSLFQADPDAKNRLKHSANKPKYKK